MPFSPTIQHVVMAVAAVVIVAKAGLIIWHLLRPSEDDADLHDYTGF